MTEIKEAPAGLDISVTNFGSYCMIEINGTLIKNVSDYSLLTTAKGTTQFSFTVERPCNVKTIKVYSN